MPYTAAAPSAPTRPSATKNTRPYMADVIPMSRTRAARERNRPTSSSARPNSFTSCAPDTLNRSVIWLFISAFTLICSREMVCRRWPTRLAGMMKMGNTTSAMRVRRHSRRIIAANVVTSTMTLLTTLPNVLVTAVCAPTTSLFSRLMSAPVWVRVKNATGMRCTLANNAERRSKMSPSPMRALHHRCTMASSASSNAAATTNPASTAMSPRLASGMAVSRMARNANGGTNPMSAAARMASRNTTMVPR